MSPTPPLSTSSNTRRRSARIKKRKIEKSTSGNTSERNDNNGTTKPKKYKTDKNGNGQCQLHHDDKLDDDAAPQYNKTVRNELQEMPHNTIYWLCYINQLSYYILPNSGSYGQEEELRHIPSLVNTLDDHYSQQIDGFTSLINDINAIHEYDEKKYYSIHEKDESMPSNYFVTHADLAKSLDEATVQDDDDEQSTTSNASSTNVGKDDEQNEDVDFSNSGISMEVELSTNNDIPPKTTFKSVDSCEEKNVRPSPTSAIEDLSPFTDKIEKSNNKSIAVLQQTTTPPSKLDSGKPSLLQSSPASAFRTVPQQHTLPPLKSPLLQSSPVSKHREQSTSQTLNDDDVPNSHTTVDIQEVDDDALDNKSNLKSDHIDTQLVDESPTATLDLDTNLSTEKEEVQVSGDSRDDSHLKSEIQQPSDMDATHDDMVLVASTPTNDTVVLSQQREDLSILTVVQLKDRLRGLNLAVSGLKQELIDRLNQYLYPNATENKEDALPTKLSPTGALLLETTSSPLVILDSWGQSHELGPNLSSIFTKLQHEYKSSSFRVIWNGMKEKYTKIDYVEYAKPKDPFLIQQKQLNDALSKFVYLVDITEKQMRKEKKGPVSYAEKELWGLLPILGIKEIHPIIAEDCNGGMFRLRKLTELKGELRGQYQLLKDLNDIINGRRKIGISNRKEEGMFRRIWEQLFPSSTNGSAEHEVEEELEEEEGATGKCTRLFLLASWTLDLVGR